MKRGQDPRFTAGMAAFDLGALQKTPNFQNIVSGLQGKASALGAQAQGLKDSQTQALQDYSAKALSEAQGGVRGSLDQSAAYLRGDEEKKAAGINKQLDIIRKNGSPQDVSNFLKSLNPAVEKRLLQTNPDAVQYLSKAKIDPTAYMNVRGNVGAKDVVTEQQAQQFNNIMSLLGKGESQTAAQDLGPLVSFDNTKAGNELIKQATGKDKESKDLIASRKAADVKKQKEADAAIAEIAAKKQADKEAKAGLELAAERKAVVDELKKQDLQQKGRQHTLNKLASISKW